MIGIRTPVKKAVTPTPPSKSPPKTKTPEAGPSAQQNVRKSVGEWEAGIGENRKLVTPPKAAPPTKTKKAPSITKTTCPPLEPLVPITNNARIEDARKHLTIVQTQMGLTRNTKKEICSAILESAKALYNIVRAAEEEAGRIPPLGQKSRTWVKETAPPRNPQTCPEQASEAEGLARSEIESFKKMLEAHSIKLTKNTEEMGRLKEALQASQTIIEHSSYASAAASQPANPPPRTHALHSIAISTEDEKATGEVVLNKIREAVRAKDEWVKVERVRKTKGRKVIMSFHSEEDRNKVKNRLKDRVSDLTVEEIKNRDPLLVLKDVLTVNSNEDIVKAMRNQNQEIFRGLSEEESRMHIKYRKKARNPHTGHVVLSTSPTVWRRVTEKGYAYIDLQRVRAEDQSPLLQCSLCLGYGHSRRYCTESIEKCSHCGGPHTRRDCADWLAESAPSCCNCVQAKLAKTDHNAFSTECAVRKRWDSVARAAIAYC